VSDRALRTRDELDDSDKKAIHKAITQGIEKVALERSICREAVANEAFYVLQRNPAWGRNATSTQKRASFARWEGRCYRCKKALTAEDAKFHHLSRGVPDQHGPSNLVPEHLRCHDDQHGVSRGSLSKGSMKRREEGA